MAAVTPDTALQAIPDGLRKPLLDEYASIVQHFSESQWKPSELSGGWFCEITYTILDGHAKGGYASKPTKPNNFVVACRKLESNGHCPRSFQILIPRMLPALYEVRNNRSVGHAGGDVDPNHMDATVVLAMCSWIMAELIRVYHDVETDEAQQLVDALVERRVPLVWKNGDMRRILNPSIKLEDQVLILLAQCSTPVSIETIFEWTDYRHRRHFDSTIAALHDRRAIEYSKHDGECEILPPGSKHVEANMQRWQAAL